MKNFILNHAEWMNTEIKVHPAINNNFQLTPLSIIFVAIYILMIGGAVYKHLYGT